VIVIRDSGKGSSFPLNSKGGQAFLIQPPKAKLGVKRVRKSLGDKP